MDITLLIALASVTLLILLSISLFFQSRTPKLRDLENRAAVRQRDGVQRRAQLARNRGAARFRGGRPREENNEESDNADVVEDDKGDVEFPDEKIGAKKRAKLEAKAEKKAQREAEEQLRQEKKKKEQQAESERRKLEEKEKAEEKAREEAEKKAREEKEKKEYEEYLKMKEAFSVEEEGYEEGDEEGQKNLLQEFVDYIKLNKVVVIEDLAAHFKLKTQSAIDRIQDLLKDEILTGVIDDRGKFIYVSSQELDAVAKFIKQRGRISITELAENSNQLINLTPTTVQS